MGGDGISENEMQLAWDLHDIAITGSVTCKDARKHTGSLPGPFYIDQASRIVRDEANRAAIMLALTS